MANDSFNRFQSAITRTTAAIGLKTSVFVGSAKVRTHIATLEKTITSLQHELGMTVYQQWEKGELNSDQISQQCRIIQEKYETIQALNEEIEKLGRQEAEVLGSRRADGDRSTDKATETYTCSGCGASFDAPAKFCRKCGTKMGA